MPERSEDPEPLHELERELTLLARHHLSHRRSRPEQTLDRSAYLLLYRLEAGGPMSIGELATALRLDVSTVNRQVGALLRQELVRRLPDPDGGLARKLQPTAHGLEMLTRDRERSQEGIGSVVRNWSPDQVATLAALLNRFNSDIEEIEGISWPRS